MTTYFGLKSDIAEIREEQKIETKISNVRLKILGDQIDGLQKQIANIRLWNRINPPANNSKVIPFGDALLSSNQKK